MKPDGVPFCYVDVVTAAVLVVGFLRGRKRGMSEELLDLLQWIAIVVVGGLFYRSVAQFFAGGSVMGPAGCNITGYLLIALAIKLAVVFIKKGIGEKLVGSDIFGRCEYYFGMLAGMIRFGCVYFFLLNLVHAPYYSAEDLVAAEKYQERWFSDIRFPTFGTFQRDVFKESATGWAMDKYADAVLIQPSATGAGDLRNDNSMGRRRERTVDAVTGGK
jgi:uncharacterized membrane protein required for colicin V production